MKLTTGLICFEFGLGDTEATYKLDDLVGQMALDYFNTEASKQVLFIHHHEGWLGMYYEIHGQPFQVQFIMFGLLKIIDEWIEEVKQVFEEAQLILDEDQQSDFIYDFMSENGDKLNSTYNVDNFSDVPKAIIEYNQWKGKINEIISSICIDSVEFNL